jgi:hypothetical protein
MPTLKKPFTLFLILSHLNAFVLDVGGMGNVYAANQVVDTTKSPTDCPLTIVSLEVLIKLQPLQSKPLGLAITTAAFLPNTSKAPFNTERLVEPTSFRIISAF